MRLHTSTAMVSTGMVLVALVSTPAPAGAASIAGTGGHVAQVLERPRPPRAAGVTSRRTTVVREGPRRRRRPVPQGR